VNVDGDRSNAAVGRSIGVSPVDAAAGREHQTAERLWVAAVVGDHRVAVDLDDVVHAALHAVGIVVEGLLGIVGGGGICPF
jgi:hypothetical protein